MAPRCPNAPCLNDCDKVKDGGKASAEAAAVFRKIAVLKDKVPQDILCKAVAIGAFDGVFNAALGFGYRQGDGAITVRTPNGWSAPVFYKMKGGSFGWQLGVTSTDYLLIFMSQDSIRDMAGGEFDLQTTANAVAGPVFGAKGSISYHAFPKDKTVFAYASTKGLFAGIRIDGARLSPRNSVNQDIYGADAEALMSNPARLQIVATSCLAPGLCDLPTAVAANAPNPVTPVVFVQPPPQPAAPVAVATPVPAEQPAPKPVIVVVEKEVIVEEQPQPQPKPPQATPRRRVHKMKN
jgi:lipid-binding SYLF domain-containing protein